MIVVWHLWHLERSRAIEQGQKAFAIAHNPFWKKQKQERFLRQSHGEDSRKPIAIRTDQAIQRARSRAKAFFKTVAWRRQQETHSHSHRPSHPKRKIKSVKSGLRQGGNEQSLLKFPPSQKQTPPPPFDKLKPTGKPKRSNRSAKPSKKPRRKPTQSRYKRKTQPNSNGCSERQD